MKRDLSDFPNDENGDVLWDMSQKGDNLSKIREVNFSVIFPSEENAMQFAIQLLKNEMKVSFSEYKESTEFPWQVTVHVMAVPTHKTIAALEDQLGEIAAMLGGQNDGWGCFGQE
jgi:hypothetical protein